MTATISVDRPDQNTSYATDYTSLERLAKNKFALDFAARKTWMRCLIAILLIAGLSFAMVAISRPKFNRSEIAYAEISREMLNKSSFIVPLYRGIPCIDKPVLN